MSEKRLRGRLSQRIIVAVLSVAMVMTIIPENAIVVKAATKSNAGVTVTTGQDAKTLASSLIGSGIKINSAKVSYADPSQVGIVNNGESLYGISGVILSTGNAKTATETGSDNSISTGTDKDSDLEALITSEGKVYGGDTASLEFSMTATGSLLNFNYVFASKEFTESMVGYNDIFGLFVSVNGGKYENIAIIPEGNPDYAGKYVTINNLREGKVISGDDVSDHTYLTADGPKNSGSIYTGISYVFSAQKIVKKGDTVSVKIVIADVGDRIGSSSVVIQGGSLSFDAPGAGLDNKEEVIKGLTKGSYKITSEGHTYLFTVDAGETVSYQGIDDNKKPYDFRGKKVTIVQVIDDKIDSEAVELSIPDKAAKPGKITASECETSIEKKTITVENIKDTQEYILVPYDTEITSAMWEKASRIGDSVDSIWFTEDTLGNPLTTANTYAVYTRVYAGDENLASDVSAKSDKIILHDHKWEDKIEKAPTCTTAGNKSICCSICGKIKEANQTIPPLGHDFSGKWTISKEPTETKDGKKITYCIHGCGRTKTENIPATGVPKENPSKGKLLKKTEVAKDAPVDSATFNNSLSELLDASDIFTEAEKMEIKNGAESRVFLTINSLDLKDIKVAEQKKIEEEAKISFGSKVVITYMDISLLKQVGDNPTHIIHTPGTDIDITIKLPEELLNKDKDKYREFGVVRLHDNDAKSMKVKFDSDTNELSFKTDKFSTYAIVYRDVVKKTDPDSTPTNPEVPKTGDGVNLWIYIIAMLGCVSAFSVMEIRRKKKQEEK